MSIALFPIMHAIAVRPAWRAEEFFFPIATFLWPTSLILMAAQPTSSTSFRVALFGISILANGVLYGLVAVIVGIVLGRLGLVERG